MPAQVIPGDLAAARDVRPRVHPRSNPLNPQHVGPLGPSQNVRPVRPDQEMRVVAQIQSYVRLDSPAIRRREGWRTKRQEKVNRNSLRPLYSGLTGEERFRLALQVGAAGDDRETMHVLRSGPGVQGTVVDPSFTTPAMASFRLASAFARAAGPYLGWLNAVEVLEDLLTGVAGQALLTPDGLLPVMMVLDRAAEGAARDLRALLDAFEDVCRERAGLSPEVLLRFWVPQMAAFLHAAERWVQDLDADAGTREGFKAALDQAWTLSLDSRGD